MKRTTVAGILTLAIIIAGGWFAGSYATSSGFINWIQFRSSNVPLCGEHRADVSSLGGGGGAWSAKERALNRSGTTCGSSHGRPASRVRVHIYLYGVNGSPVLHDYADNSEGGYEAYLRFEGPVGTCWSTVASGREYDSDIGGYRTPSSDAYSGQICSA